MSPFIYVLTTNGVLFLISIIYWKFPPNKINSWYGYRTPKAMQNQQIWDFANTNFNQTFLMYSGFSLLGGLLLASFTKVELNWEPMILVMLSIIVSIIKTERAINDNFSEEGKRKK
jgi:uncharacterized membrane protein